MTSNSSLVASLSMASRPGRSERLPEGSPIRARHHGEVWGLDMYRALARSRITLNRHIDVAENNANNMRLYEATGVGALLITDRKDNLGELFEVGREVVAYGSAEEAVELIRHYIAHPEEARGIALEDFETIEPALDRPVEERGPAPRLHAQLARQRGVGRHRAVAHDQLVDTPARHAQQARGAGLADAQRHQVLPLQETARVHGCAQRHAGRGRVGLARNRTGVGAHVRRRVGERPRPWHAGPRQGFTS